MSTGDLLSLMRLLSSLETWSFSQGARLPDHLLEALSEQVKQIEVEILKGMK